jgi:aspartyl/asparaginyl-tRNA synthetase
MSRTLISEVLQSVEQKVTIKGFVNKIRNQKYMQFLIVRDHTGFVQTVNERGANHQVEKVLAELTPESAVEVTGHVVANEKVKLGGCEIIIESVKVANLATSPLPIDEKTNQEQRLD